MRKNRVLSKTLGAVAALVVLGAVAFIYSGVYNIAADEPHWSVTEWVLETTRTQSIKARLEQVQVPSSIDSPERVRKGATAYADMCEVCHLAPGAKATPVHKGLNPQPPELAQAGSHVHSPDYIFWVLKHGIKMTGMPSWGETHSDEELWDLVAFVQKLPELSREEYSRLTTQSTQQGHGDSHQH